jgi:hypothetical protein
MLCVVETELDRYLDQPELDDEAIFLLAQELAEEDNFDRYWKRCEKKHGLYRDFDGDENDWESLLQAEAEWDNFSLYERDAIAELISE